MTQQTPEQDIRTIEERIAALEGGFSAKAFVNFNGSTKVIASQGNVSSVTAQGGAYRIHFTVPLASANYCYSISVNNSISGNYHHIIEGVAKDVAYFDVNVDRHSAGSDRQSVDVTEMCVVIY
jgi:hypothetical protein